MSVSLGTYYGTRVGLNVTGFDELLANMADFPDKMKTKIMRNALSASGTPIRRLARQLAPRGASRRFNIRGKEYQRTKPLAETLTKKLKFYDKSFTGVELLGSSSWSAPHGHFVSGGTGALITSPLPKRSSFPRKGNRDYDIPPGKVLRIPVEELGRYSGGAQGKNIKNGYVFIRGPHTIKNKGSRPNPWWEFASQRAGRESLRVMAAVLETEITKAFDK